MRTEQRAAKLVDDAVRVVQREEVQDPVLRRPPPRVHQVRHLRRHRRVRVHDAFRPARGACPSQLKSPINQLN